MYPHTCCVHTSIRAIAPLDSTGIRLLETQAGDLPGYPLCREDSRFSRITSMGNLSFGLPLGDPHRYRPTERFLGGSGSPGSHSPDRIDFRVCGAAGSRGPSVWRPCRSVEVFRSPLHSRLGKWVGCGDRHIHLYHNALMDIYLCLPSMT